MSNSAGVIICTRDRPGVLLDCLRGIEAQSVQPDEIIVVAGTRESLPAQWDEISARLPLRVEWCPEKNICRARNTGLRACRSGIAVFIDDDATPHPGWLGAIVDAITKDDSVWAVGGHVLDSRPDPPELEFAFGTLRRSGRQRPVRNGPGVPADTVATVKGCNFAVRVARTHELGGFDEFFAYGYDEADLVIRIWDAGGRVEHAPGALVDHHHTPGLFRQAHPLDRDWAAELSSHTYFGLKHTSGAGRLWVRLLVRIRVAKLLARAIVAAASGRYQWRHVLRPARLAAHGVSRGESASR